MPEQCILDSYVRLNDHLPSRVRKVVVRQGTGVRNPRHVQATELFRVKTRKSQPYLPVYCGFDGRSICC